MRKKDINQNELAEKTGLSAPTISRVLNNPMTATIENLLKVGEVLGLSAEQLFSSIHNENFMPIPVKVEFLCHTVEDMAYFNRMISQYYSEKYGKDYNNESFEL